MSEPLRRIRPLVVDGLLLSLPILPYALLVLAYGRGLGLDLHIFWEAARAVGHGNSPYDPAGVAQMRAATQSDPSLHPVVAWAVYPPPLFVALVPLGVLPWPLAAGIGMTVLAVSPALALWVMGLRDWRCYLVAYASLPISTSIALGAISTSLMLGFALLWRGRSIVAASAATIIAKLFLWPLAIVVAAVHGPRRAAILLAVAVSATLGSWAVIGFADVERYPGMLSDLSALEAHNSFSANGLAYALGAPLPLGTYAGLALGLTAACLAFRAGARGQRDAAFTLALVAALLASPIVWAHYLTLLFLPLAARFPRFNWLWGVPLVLWAYPEQGASGDAWAFVGFWSCIAIIVIATVRSEHSAGPVVARPRCEPSPLTERNGRRLRLWRAYAQDGYLEEHVGGVFPRSLSRGSRRGLRRRTRS
jgi:alpha-1,2-mannosyltransferase